MMGSLPSGDLRDGALERIKSLDCANPDTRLASCDSSIAPPPQATAWRKALEDARVDDAAYTKALAGKLKTLICANGDDAAHVPRGLFQFGGRLAETGPEAPALLDFIMSKDCPVSVSLTDVDKADLLRIKQADLRSREASGPRHALAPMSATLGLADCRKRPDGPVSAVAPRQSASTPLPQRIPRQERLQNLAEAIEP